jgi:ABC-type branched-subunit amino acid transport system permease subunit
MPDITVIATTAIAGAGTVLGALVGALGTAHTTKVETRRRNWEYQVKRRAERQETYQKAIDLLTDWGVARRQ